MTDEIRVGEPRSQVFVGCRETTTTRPDFMPTHEVGPLYVSSVVVNRSPLHWPAKKEPKAYRMRRAPRHGSPAEKGRDAKHRVPSRWECPTTPYNSIRGLAPVPPVTMPRGSVASRLIVGPFTQARYSLLIKRQREKEWARCAQKRKGVSYGL